jgi:hypothetical protein
LGLSKRGIRSENFPQKYSLVKVYTLGEREAWENPFARKKKWTQKPVCFSNSYRSGESSSSECMP